MFVQILLGSLLLLITIVVAGFGFWMMGIFWTFEKSVYFALVAFTTLGFGDVLLPVEWWFLSGMAAANGLVHIGIVTAFLVEGVRLVRLQQLSALEDDS